METKKYYWVKYEVSYAHGKTLQPEQTVLDKHPFEWLQDRNTNITKRKILDWKEITEEEYKMGLKAGL